MVAPLVDFSLVTGADIPSQYLRLGHPAYGKLGTGQLADSALLESYSDRIMSMSVTRASTRSAGPLIEYSAGTATMELLNDDGALDPVNLAGLIPPGSVVRIRAMYNGITYPVFYGYVSSWIPEHRAPSHSVITVNAVDGMGTIAGYNRIALDSPVGSSEDTGARVNRILDSVGWPSDARNIATGNSLLQHTYLEGDALSELQDAVRAEIGEAYVDADGSFFFRGRQSVITDARSNSSQATFGAGAGEIHYVGMPGLSYDRDQLTNLVTASRNSDTPVDQVADDPASRERYRDHAYSQSGLLLQTDEEVLDWAKYVVRTDSTPELRFTEITLDGRLDSDLVVPQALGRRIGDRITIVRRPPGVFDSREVIVRSIAHTWSPPDQWKTTWSLQAADRLSFFVLGDDLRGRLDYNALTY